MIKVGDTVSIPKGTIIVDGPGDQYANQAEIGPSKRASKVKVQRVADWSRHWHMLMPESDQKRLVQIANVNYFGALFPRYPGERHRPSTDPVVIAAIDEIKAKLDAIYGDYMFVSWSGDKKHCPMSAVESVEVEVKAPKEQAITKRRLLVPGSKWSFPNETPINLYVLNGDRERLIQQRHPKGGWMRDPEIAAMPGRVLAEVAVIPAGTTFEVLDKPSPDNVNYGTDKKFSNGSFYLVRTSQPIQHNIAFGDRGLVPSPLYSWRRNDDFTMLLPYSVIDKHAVAEAIPEMLTYVLRDSATGEFFGGWEFEIDGYGQNRSTNTPKMSKTFSGSKKYANISAVKASIMDFTGYHAGIELETYAGDWVGQGDKKIDLPPTWEIAVIDKTTNTEKGVHDVQDWFKELMRLRTITKNVNGAVRGLYKKIEENKADYPVIVTFEFDPSVMEMEDDEKLSPRDRELIKDAMAANADDKAPNHKTPMTQAYAVKTQTDATLIIMGYQGIGVAKAYETENLTELVIAG